MVLRVLYVLRHAKSSWKDDSLADVDRPLNKRGKRDAPFMAEILKADERRPDYIQSSHSKRTKQTLKYMREWLGDREVIKNKRIYHCDASDLIAAIKGFPTAAGSALICGHNPSIDDLLLELSGETHEVPTCGIAKFLVKGDWADFGPEIATLQWVDYPKKHPGYGKD